MKTNYILLVLVLWLPTCIRHICQFCGTTTLLALYFVHSSTEKNKGQGHYMVRGNTCMN